MAIAEIGQLLQQLSRQVLRLRLAPVAIHFEIAEQHFQMHAALSQRIGDIDQVEQLVATLTTRLGDPATYSDGSDIAALNRELTGARIEAERLTARWEELETRRSASS